MGRGTRHGQATVARFTSSSRCEIPAGHGREVRLGAGNRLVYGFAAAHFPVCTAANEVIHARSRRPNFRLPTRADRPEVPPGTEHERPGKVARAPQAPSGGRLQSLRQVGAGLWLRRPSDNPRSGAPGALLDQPDGSAFRGGQALQSDPGGPRRPSRGGRLCGEPSGLRAARGCPCRASRYPRDVPCPHAVRHRLRLAGPTARTDHPRCLPVLRGSCSDPRGIGPSRSRARARAPASRRPSRA